MKKSVENSPVTAVITYDAGNYGSFTSSEEISVTVAPERPPFELPISWPMIVILAAIVVGIVVGASLLRR